ncbi:2-hydroxychromene-2-carboxylate isomerase [Streptomyces sp. NPDC001828]|uniref:2-hydroxychromene-2-carboxylate isomerase n=1 Tax=Streptomyces sp. NPDC001828 TaxID=3364615 RepID=UPI0036AFA27A
MGAVQKTPRFYFSLRSPYSWLAHRALMADHPDVAALVEWRPFFEPDAVSDRMLTEAGGTFPYAAMTRAKHLYVLQDVGRIAKSLDVKLSWPVDRDPVWEIPHLAYLVARREGRGPQYIAAAYRARWEEGRNICDRSVIAGIGAELGLDSAELAAASDDPELREEGVRLLLDVCADGVFGVPFFVHGFSRFWGLDRLPGFVAHLRERGLTEPALPEPVGAAVGLGPRSVDDGHAGGCG